jgi:hypothetical protein
VRFNGDSAANYDMQYTYALNAALQAAGLVGQTFCGIGYAPGTSCAANVFAALVATIPNYTNTSMHKNMEWACGYADATAGNSIRVSTSNRWRSTAAITQIGIAATGSGNFKAGSRVTLLGMQ